MAISPLVTLECLVGPPRDENLGLHDHYPRALDQFHRLPLHGCHQLWTNDSRRAEAAHGLAVVVPGDS